MITPAHNTETWIPGLLAVGLSGKILQSAKVFGGGSVGATRLSSVAVYGVFHMRWAFNP
ncbi:hypothetical protein HG15A2_40520 [Adhaeretor mobilis]|uniref:Uncharacterized protein n=1 Tax=Adhaeretor mobilis TaxID=1930276 RepID=A0A517N0Q1_9BACT|nr:hypothetical protein HG15A2_40520 [Adhaeretor mobilis]